MITKERTDPSANFQLLEPKYASPATMIKIIGHGAAIKIFSSFTKKKYRGSKNASISAPYFLEKLLNEASIPFFKSLKSLLPRLGISVQKSISLPKNN